MNLKEKLKRIKSNINECNHPLWYFWSEETKTLSKVWKCQCLKCNVLKIDKIRKFNGKVIINKQNDAMFESVQFDYDYLEKKNLSEEKIKTLLINKYNR